MKTIQIGGYTAQDFGSNNYSHGMSAIIFSTKDITVQEVRTLPGVFLHPTVEPNSEEIFALLGTQEQFDAFYKDAVNSYAAKKAFDKFGIPAREDDETWFNFADYHDEIVHDFVPWYTYYAKKM